ncbi:phage major capsid protein [Candidatus Clostridium helianthi]|uniref:Phage major capsid protein n=1 Tax=Candidatus Clostridium helianthi TaxID=3381660 RepID=A0ABW8S7W0_9CLOT
MTNKALRERKWELTEQIEALLNACEKETRDFSQEENTQYLEFEKELRAVIEQLNTNEKNLEENKGEKNMDKFEKREFGMGLAKGEVRADTTTHSNIIPSEMYNEVIQKLSEMSTVVADAQMVKATGKLEFLVEKEDVLAEVLGETDEISPVDLKAFDKVVLADKRIGTLVLVSKQLLHNNPVIGVDYITNTLAKRVSRKLEEQAFKATGQEREFTSGILTAPSLALKTAGTLDIDDVQNLILDMNPVLLNGAKIYINRDTFKKLSSLKDGQGRYYVVRDYIADKPVYKVLGVEIQITEAIIGLQIVLANVNEALKFKLAENTNVQVLTEKFSLSSQVGVLVEFYGDCALVNAAAARVLK